MHATPYAEFEADIDNVETAILLAQDIGIITDDHAEKLFNLVDIAEDRAPYEPKAQIRTIFRQFLSSCEPDDAPGSFSAETFFETFILESEPEDHSVNLPIAVVFQNAAEFAMLDESEVPEEYEDRDTYVESCTNETLWALTIAVTLVAFAASEALPAHAVQTASNNATI